jgi:hypothetical protein
MLNPSALETPRCLLPFNIGLALGVSLYITLSLLVLKVLATA